MGCEFVNPTKIAIEPRKLALFVSHRTCRSKVDEIAP